MCTNIAQAKQALRRELKARRSAISAARREAYDRQLLARLAALDIWQVANTLFCYIPMADEVNTRPIIEAAWAAGKTVAVPCCISRTQLAFFKISSFGGLVQSPFGIWEPADDPAQFPPVDPAAVKGLIILPGIAFTRQGDRLGYGGGYYDRLLAGCSLTTVGLCYPELLQDSLPADIHDRAAHWVITPKETLEI